MSPMSYQQLPKLQNTVEVDPLNEDYDPPSLPHQNYEEIRDFGFNQTRPLTPVGPRAIKHAVHWSSSTNTTAVTSETSSQQSGRKAGSSRARTWAFEMMAIAISLGAVASIIGVVFRYNGRALPDWPHDITLNALIALLATFANAAMSVCLSSGISQAKWIRFKTAPSPLSDMEAFDEASRGSWGAVKLLVTTRGG